MLELLLVLSTLLQGTVPVEGPQPGVKIQVGMHRAAVDRILQEEPVEVVLGDYKAGCFCEYRYARLTITYDGKDRVKRVEEWPPKRPQVDTSIPR
jgi:hypothetical protein